MGDIVKTRLSLQYQTGYKDDGNPIFKSKHYRNITILAEDAALWDAALALASLQRHELDMVERYNTYELGM